MNLYEKRCIDLYSYRTDQKEIYYKKKSELKKGDLCVRSSDNVIYKIESILNEKDDFEKTYIVFDFGKFTVHNDSINRMFLNII